MNEPALSPHHRMLFSALAEALVPAGGAYPSATDADVAGAGLEIVLRARQDLVAPLVAVLDRAEDSAPLDFVRELEADNPAAFSVLTLVTAAGYFAQPNVRTAFSFFGNEANYTHSAEDDETLMELLQPVWDRGPCYRSVAAEDE